MQIGGMKLCLSPVARLLLFKMERLFEIAFLDSCKLSGYRFNFKWKEQVEIDRKIAFRILGHSPHYFGMKESLKL